MRIDDLVEKTVESQGLQDNYYKNVYIPEFARDVVLYGRSDIMGVLEIYDISPEDFAEIAKLPLFLAEVANLKARLASSENAAIQIKASELLDATLHTIQSRLVGGGMSNKDLIATGKFLGEVLGINAKGKSSDIIGPVNTGTVVKISYGGAQSLSDLQVIEGDAPVNETYKKVRHLYSDSIVEGQFVEDKP